MSTHLKTRTFRAILATCGHEVKLAPHTPHKRGVHYFVPYTGITSIHGAMDHVKDGNKCRKRIVVRPSRHRPGLHECYAYHFPTSWSQACQDNRSLIKQAQRLAHALERERSFAAIEWRISFLKHYFTVYKGGAQPEPGMKAYARFYQYVYVSIYRSLKAAQQESTHDTQTRSDEVTFEPVISRHHKNPFVVTSDAAFPLGIPPKFISPGKKMPENLHMCDFCSNFAPKLKTTRLWQRK